MTGSADGAKEQPTLLDPRPGTPLSEFCLQAVCKQNFHPVSEPEKIVGGGRYIDHLDGDLEKEYDISSPASLPLRRDTSPGVVSNDQSGHSETSFVGRNLTEAEEEFLRQARLCWDAEAQEVEK